MSDEQQEYEKRIWYTNRATGERGYEVFEGGAKFIRYDRGPNSPMVDFNKREWEPMQEEIHKLTPAQLSRVLHAADYALRRVLNDHADHPLWAGTWNDLGQEEKRQLFDVPPPGKQRARQWAFLKKAHENMVTFAGDALGQYGRS